MKNQDSELLLRSWAKATLRNIVLPFRVLTGSNSPTRLDLLLGCAATLGGNQRARILRANAAMALLAQPHISVVNGSVCYHVVFLWSFSSCASLIPQYHD